MQKSGAISAIGTSLLFLAYSPAAARTFDYEIKLLPPGPLAMSGNTVVAAGVVVARTERAWVQQALLPMNFSQGVAIDGDTLVVLPDIYVRNGSTWSVQQEIIGWGIPALNSNTLAVGEWNIGEGEIEIGQRTGTNWSLTTVFTANGNSAGRGLGVSLAIDGDTVVAGAPLEYGAPTNALPAAYVFVRSGTNWSQQAQLRATQLETGFQLGLDFGMAVALSGDTIAVGDPRDGTRGSYAGAVYVFARSGTNWLLQQKLTALDGGATNYFGFSVALAGDRLVVGSPCGTPNNPATQSGSAYVFARNGTNWVQAQKLMPSDSTAGDHFGISVAVGTNAVVVAKAVQSGYTLGSTYIYEPTPAQPLVSGVSVTAPDAFANEDGNTATLLITRIGSTGSPLTVHYGVGGTAAGGSHYFPLPGEVTIPAGETSAEVVITAIDDAIYDPGETVVLTLSPDPAYVIGYPASGTITILDNDQPPLLSVVATDPTASECVPQPPSPPDWGVFTIYRGGNTNGSVNVFFNFSGTAGTNDFEQLGNSILIPAGVTSTQLTIKPLPAPELEGQASVILTLAPASGYMLGSLASATVLIADCAPWQDADVGPVGASGAGSQTNGTFSVIGSGADIAGASDAFHYYYRVWKGDGTAIVRVTGIQTNDPWARAGLMFRSSLAPDSANAFMYLRSGSQTGFQCRSSTGQDTALRNGSWFGASSWLKLIRRGNSFIGYESTDGKTWGFVGSANQSAMPETIFVGLAITSHEPGALCEADFDSMNLSPVAAIPYPPSGLGVAVFMNRFKLSWIDNSSDEQGFVVESSWDSMFQYPWRVATLPPNATGFSEGPFGASITRFYRVGALGSDGVSAYSDIVMATTPHLGFAGLTRASDGSVDLTLWGEFNWNCTVEASTNLVNWTPLTNYVNSSGSRTVTDYSAARYPARFYRAVGSP